MAQQAAEGALHYLVRDDQGLHIHPFEGDPGKLLVHQLLMTEAFGHASDESLQTETLKGRYRELYDKSSGDDSSAEEMKKISDQIGQRPVDDYRGVAFTPEQRAMLEKMTKSRQEDNQ